MTHNRKKAAVEKFSKLHASGVTVEELTLEVTADEKAYTPEEVAEIIEAITNPPAPGADNPGDENQPPAPKAKASGKAGDYIVCEEWRMEPENGKMAKLKKLRDNVKLTQKVYDEYDLEDRRKHDTIQYFATK